MARAVAQPQSVPQEAPQEARQEAPQNSPYPDPAPGPTSFLEVVELFAKHREMQLRTVLRRQVRLVRMEPGLLELQPVGTVDEGTLGRIGKHLSDWTGRRWMVSLTNEAGQPSLAEQEEQERVRQEDEALSHPLVKAVLSHFPDASLESIRELTETVPEDVSGEPVGGDPLDHEDDEPDDMGTD